MNARDWFLAWCWFGYVAFLGPFLISARDSILVAGGFGMFLALVYFTQRRLVPIIKGKLK